MAPTKGVQTAACFVLKQYLLHAHAKNTQID